MVGATAKTRPERRGGVMVQEVRLFEEENLFSLPRPSGNRAVLGSRQTCRETPDLSPLSGTVRPGRG